MVTLAVAASVTAATAERDGEGARDAKADAEGPAHSSASGQNERSRAVATMRPLGVVRPARCGLYGGLHDGHAALPGLVDQVAGSDPG